MYRIKGPNAWQQVKIGGFKTRLDAENYMRKNHEYYDIEHIKRYFGGDEKRWFNFMIEEY